MSKRALTRFITSVSALALALGGAAGAARAETLAEVIAYAAQTNPGLQAQRAALRALDESYVQARTGYAPSVSASLGATRYEDRRSGSTASAYTQSNALSVVQPLYTGGRVSGRLTAAEAQIRAGRESLRRYEQDLLQRVVNAYLSVRRDEQLLRINEDTVAVLEKELADTKAKGDAHVITLTDVAQARARLAQARSQLVTARTQLTVSRAQFLGVVGQNPGTLEPPPPLDLLPATLDQAFDAAENNNPQLLGAQYVEQGSRARTAQAKAEWLPSVSARFDLQRVPTEPYLRTPYDSVKSASVTMSIPLYTGGQVASVVRQSVEENNRDRLTVDDTRLQVVQTVTTAWEQLLGLRQQLSSLNEEVKADQIAFYGVREEEKFALRSTIEVLNAELELTNAQQNLVRARASEYVSRVQLLAATGVLTVEMLSPAATSYDSSANFRRVRDKGFRPLELPVRVLDSLAAPPLDRPRPASIAGDRPNSTSILPAPDEETPIISILSILQRAPVKPKP